MSLTVTLIGLGVSAAAAAARGIAAKKKREEEQAAEQERQRVATMKQAADKRRAEQEASASQSILPSATPAAVPQVQLPGQPMPGLTYLPPPPIRRVL